jgi:hypothetical protein
VAGLEEFECGGAGALGFTFRADERDSRLPGGEASWRHAREWCQ